MSEWFHILARTHMCDARTVWINIFRFNDRSWMTRNNLLFVWYTHYRWYCYIMWDFLSFVLIVDYFCKLIFNFIIGLMSYEIWSASFPFVNLYARRMIASSIFSVVQFGTQSTGYPSSAYVLSSRVTSCFLANVRWRMIRMLIPRITRLTTQYTKVLQLVPDTRRIWVHQYTSINMTYHINFSRTPNK